MVQALNIAGLAHANLQTHGVRPEEAHAFSTYATMTDRLERKFFSNNPLMMVGGLPMNMARFAAAAILAKTSILSMGAPGGGKSLLAELIYSELFGANGPWMRVDMDLNIRRYFCRINPGGKTAEEVFKIREDMIKAHIAVADEINRAHGAMLNPFLGLADNNLILDGERARDLGDGFFLLLATANPISDATSGTFQLDEALEDRFLCLDVDGIKPCEGDMMLIGMNSAGRDKLVPSDTLVKQIIRSHKYLLEDMEGTNEEQMLNRAARALIGEIVFRAFRFVTDSDIYGAAVIDKNREGWRAKIPTGNHSNGAAFSYCSAISPRALRQAEKLAQVLCSLALTQKKLENDPISNKLDVYLKTYLDCIKLAMGRRHNFLPLGVAAQLNIDRLELIESAFVDVGKRINTDALAVVICAILEFKQKLDNGKSPEAKKIMENAKETNNVTKNPELGYAIIVMERWLDTHKQQQQIKDAAVAARVIVESSPLATEIAEEDARSDVAHVEYNQDATNKYIQGVAQKNLELIKDGLDEGADPNACDDNGTPMIVLAVTSKNYDGMKLILENGVDINGIDTQGATAIAHAILKLDVEAVEILLAHDPKLTATIKGNAISMNKLLDSVEKKLPNKSDEITRIRDILNTKTQGCQ